MNLYGIFIKQQKFYYTHPKILSNTKIKLPYYEATPPRLKGLPNSKLYLTHTTHIPFKTSYLTSNFKTQTLLQLKNQSRQNQCFLHSAKSTILFVTQNSNIKSHPGVFIKNYLNYSTE